MQELEKKIHDFIKECYKAEFTGLLKVSNDNGIYSLVLGIPSYMAPTTLSLQADSDEEFLNYVKKELVSNNYVRVDFYKIVKET